jgi:HK97 family phage portal protein
VGVLDRVNAAHAELRSTELRAVGGVPWRPWDDSSWRFDVGGPAHPTRQAGMGGVDGALRLGAVYACVRFLAEGVAKLPLQQFRDLGDRTVRMPPGQLLSKPSAFLRTFDWLYQYVASAALHGNAWGLITGRDGYGFPTSIEWLPDEAMDVEDASPWNPARAKFFFYGKPVDRAQLVHIPAFTVPGRTKGISPLRAFQLLIQSGQDAQAYGADWFKGGGFPPGTFQNTEYEVDEEQADKIKGKLVRAQRRREPLVHGRDWKYTPVTVPPSEAQFVEAMQLNATQIAVIYGVQPRRAGGIHGDSQTYSNVSMDQLSEITDSLDPWLVRLETALKDCLPGQQYAQFNRNARLRMTPEARYATYRTARDIGLMNVDEIRALEELEPLPRPTDPTDYDGQDYTPLTIQIAAARGLKEELGVGTGGVPEVNPENAKAGQAPPPAPGVPAGKPPPVPAANGHGKKPAGG